MAVTNAQVQALYIAYFNRPADFLGLPFQVAQAELHGLQAVADNFAASPEYLAQYEGMGAAQIINTIYMNLFGRAAEPAGIEFWGGHYNSGLLSLGTIALAIFNGAQNDDLVAVNNKVAAAEAFYAALDTSEEIVAYSGDDANLVAKAWMSTITTDASLEAAIEEAALDATMATVVAAGTPEPTVNLIDLTTATDNVVGTAGADEITGSNTTFTGLDKINGGEGVDKLILSDVAGAALNVAIATSVTNIETLELTSTAGLGGAAADVSGWTGLTSATFVTKATVLQTITADAATDVTVSNTGAGAFTVNGGADVAITTGAAAVIVNGDGGLSTVTVVGGTTVAIDDDGEESLTSVSLSGNTGASTIAADALTSLSLAKGPANATVTAAEGTRELALTVNKLTAGTISDTTATSIAITSTGAASTGVTLTTDFATAVTVAGDKSLSMALTDAGGNAAVVSTITSTNTAGLTVTSALGTAVTFTGGAGADEITVGATTKTITTGAGDDTVNVSVSALGTGGTVDAGEGTADVLAMSSANAETASATTTFAGKVSGFEVLSLGATAAGTDTVDLANLDAINYVISAGTAAGAAATPATAEVTTVTIGGSATNADSVVFDGTTVTFADGDTAIVAAGKIAAASYANFTITNVGAVLTVTAKTLGNTTDLLAGNFVFTNVSDTGVPTISAVAVTQQGTPADAGNAATAEVQNVLVVGTATGAVTFLGHEVAGTVATQAAAAVITAIVADKVAVIAAWNAANPTRELADIADGAGDSIDLTFAATEGDVAQTAGANSAGISFGAATTTTPGVAAVAATPGTTEIFTVTFAGTADGADTIAYAGTTTTLADGDNATTIATKVAAAINADGANIWSATSAGAVVTLTADAVGAVVDPVAGDFTITNVDVDATVPTATITAITQGTAATTGTAGVLALTNLASGGTLEINDEGTYSVGITGASSGTADVANLVLASDSDLSAGTVTIASVETVNITTSNLEDADSDDVHTDDMTLVATSAKTIVVTGNAGLDLTNTGNTKVTSFDASAVTLFGDVSTAALVAAAETAAAVVFVSANSTTTASVTIKGGAGDDELTGNAASDTIIGGNGDDVLAGGAGVNTLTGGAGEDEFIFAVAESAVKASTITDLAADDIITLSAAIVEAVVDGEMGAALTGLDATTAVFQDFVDAAVAATTVADVSWFQFQGNTYVVQDLGANSVTFENGVDNIVKITGLVDLTDSTIAGSSITIV